MRTVREKSGWRAPAGWVWMGLCTAFCVVQSIPFLQNRSFWVDEIYTYNLLQGSWREMIVGTMQDVHPPFYYGILRVVLTVLGPSERSYRLASFLPFLILAVVAAGSMRRRLGVFPASFLVLASGLMPYAMRTNAEARMYSWAMLFVTLCGYGMYLILKEPSRKAWVFFTLMALGAAYTHYYAFLTVCFFYLTLLIALLCEKKPVRGFWCCVAASVLGYLPWLIPFAGTLGRTAGTFWLTWIPTLWDTLQLLYSDHIAGILLLALHGLAMAAFLVWQGRKGRTAEWWLVFGTVLTTVGILGVGYGASHLIRPLFLERYFYPVCGMLWLAFGVSVQRLAGKRWVGAVVMAGVLALLLDCWWKPCRAKAQELREVSGIITRNVEFVEQNAQPGDCITSTLGLEVSENALRFYFGHIPGLRIVSYESGEWLQKSSGVFFFTEELAGIPPEAEEALLTLGIGHGERSPANYVAAKYCSCYYYTEGEPNGD